MRNPQTIGGLKVTELVTMDGYKFKLEDGGWMLIRFSGTEPIMRVYARRPIKIKSRPFCRTACGSRDWHNRGLADRHALPSEP